MNTISIIIPVYNVEKYLEQCLDSIINQTYQTLEIILVNDGSTDLCPEICDMYGAKDKRITVIHQPNGGLSAARNAGLKIASGDFISFVDSDDLLSPHFFQKLFTALSAHNADIAECEFMKFVKEEDIQFIPDKAEGPIKVFEGEMMMKALFKGPLHVMVWNKLYKTSLVRGRLFPVNRISEDVFWTYKIYGEATKTVKIDEELYFYRQRDNSIMASRYSIKRLDSLDAYEEKIEYLKSKFPNLVQGVRKDYCFVLIDNYIQLKHHIDVDQDKFHQKNILKKIRKYNKLSLLRQWHWKDIVWYQLFIMSPKHYMNLRNYIETRVKK